MMWPSFETMTPEPSEFCTSACITRVAELPRVLIEKLERIEAVLPANGDLFEVLTLTTEE